MAKRPPKVKDLPPFPSKYTIRPTNYEQRQARRYSVYTKAHETEYDAICRQLFNTRYRPDWEQEVIDKLEAAGWDERQIRAKITRLHREGMKREKKMDALAEEIGIPMRRVDRWIDCYKTGESTTQCWACKTRK
jgi:hypothetical protein